MTRLMSPALDAPARWQHATPGASDLLLVLALLLLVALAIIDPGVLRVALKGWR